MKKATLFILTLALALTAKAQLLQERSYFTDGLPKFMASSVPDGQGNALFSAMALQSSKYNSRFLLVKPNLDTLWTRKGPDNLHNSIQGLIKTQEGKFLFYATKKHPNSLSTFGAVSHKLNRNGQTAWSKVYYDNIGTGNGASAVLNMPDKGFMLGGGFSINGQTKTYAIARTDSLGNILWKKHYTHSTSDGLYDMQFTANGNIIAAGNSDIPVGPRHLKLMLLNQNGDSLKGVQLPVNCLSCYESMYADLGSVTATADGGALITAAVDTTINNVRAPYRGMLVKVDASLQLEWHYVLRTPALPIETHLFSSVKELADRSILALGFRQQPNGSNTFRLYRFNSLGQLLQTYPFSSSICAQVDALTLDALNDSTFLVGGGCDNFTPFSSGLYAATIKIPGLPPVLPTITAIKPELVSAQLSLGQSYPNPAQDQAIIPYRLPNNTRNAKILLTDITGREVGSYSLKTNQKQGSLPVNLSRLSNGLYLYSLMIDGKPVATKKLAVAR